MTITKKHTKRLTPLLASLLVVCIIIVVFTALELTNTTHFFHHQQAVSGTIPSSNPKAQTPTENQSKPVSQSPKNNNAAQTTTTSVSSNKSQAPINGSLITPYGTFVSNHHPNLDGSPAPSQEQSTCQTSPGASCYITFSNNGVVKTLAAQNTGNDGVAIWNWDISKAGLTEGAWEINVIASLNGATKTANDSMQLEVGP